MHVLLLETIALVGATVHTMEPGPEPGGVAAPMVATVLIEDGLIQAVGPDVVVPEDARVVELNGLHLVPGLIDGFATFDAGHDPLWLAAGVTLVRDGGSPVGSMIPEKDIGMRDRGPGPSLLISSPVFAAPSTPRTDAFLLGAPEAAASQLGELMKMLGEANAAFDYFNFDGSLDEGQHRVVCQTALEVGVEAWGPIPRGLDVARARGAGQRSLVGLESLLPAGQRFETLEDPSILDGVVTALAQGEWRVAPMLMGTARILRGAEAEEEPRALDAIGRVYEVAWRADIEAFRILRATDALGPVETSVARQRAFVKKLFDAEVQLVPGSGAPSGMIAPGAGLVDELEEWTRAGIPAPDVLALATVGAAKALGVGDARGRIAPGMAADLVALASDPRRSISALRQPEVVVVRGAVRESFDLEDAVVALEKRQALIREARSRPIALAPPPMPPGEVLLEGVADIVAYGDRTSVERYSVVRTEDGRMAYGARVRVPSTATEPARELVLVQFIESGLVETFDLTLDVLGPDGRPQLGEGGSNAFLAQGRRVGETKKIAIERARFGVRVDTKRAEEAIAVVDGSVVLVGLIAAMHFPEGLSYVVAFDGVAMEPLVDRVQMRIDADDHRLDLADSRGGRVYGFDAGGGVQFAARASAGGRLDVEPVEGALRNAARKLEIPEDRVFTGDPERWAMRPGTGGDDSSEGDGR